MKTYCNFHPTRPAKWNCNSCNTKYCAACIDKREVEKYGQTSIYYFCPKCNVEVKKVAFKNIVEPFWNRIPKFFAYPFHPQPLTLMTLLGVLTPFFADSFFIGSLIFLALWGTLLKYSFISLKETASGKLTPPNFDFRTINSDFNVLFKQLGIFIILGILFFQVSNAAGSFAGVLFLCFAILYLPAIIIVLAVDGSLINALNPNIFAKMAWRVGWGYVLMYFFLIILGGAPTVLGEYIILSLPSFFQPFLLPFAEAYYTIISYHLMGYVIYQYHEEIGYDLTYKEEDEALPFQEQRPVEDEKTRILHKARILSQEGKIDEAISMIKKDAKEVEPDVHLVECYYNLLKIKQLTPEILKHGRTYLDFLEKEGDPDKCCEVYLECLAKDPGFTPNAPALIKIMGYLNDAGKSKEAIEAANRFIKANPKHEAIPNAYFLVAMIFNEKIKNTRKASDILKFLIKKYPGHEIASRAKTYLREMGKV